MSDIAGPSSGATKRAAARTGLLAIVHAVLILIAYLLLSPAPAPSSSNAAFTEYYSSSASNTAAIAAGFYLLPFAGIAFMWFIIAFRIWIRRASDGLRDELYSTGQLVSGVVYLTLLLVAASTISVLAFDVGTVEAGIDASLARQLTEMSWTLAVVFSGRMAAIFVGTTAVLGRRHSFLPQWFTVASYVIAVALLLGPIVSKWLILVMPIWMLAIGALLLVRSRSWSDTATEAPAASPEVDSISPGESHD